MTSANAHHPSIRVARVITRLNIGGPSIQAIELTARLSQRGAVTRLLHGRLGEGEGDMRYLATADAPLAFIAPMQRPIAPLDDLRALVAVYREMRRFQPTIVHTHMAKAGLVGRVAATLYNLTRGSAPRARVIHTYHGHVLEGYFSAWMTWVFVSIERLLAIGTDRIIAIAPAIHHELLEGHRIGRADQYRVVPLGFDLREFAAIDEAARRKARTELQIPEGASVVSTVGRLTAIKHYSLFLEAFARVAGRHPEATALIAGDGELRASLQAQAGALGIAERVRFLGWRRDLSTIYAASDIFLLTSRNEGTPVALIEAMAAGVPGVCTNVGGVKDVVDAPSSGRLAPFGDADALAAHVSELLNDPATRRAVGERARQRVLDRYGIDRLVSDIETLYAELVQ
jgi:glycosyltransferase involved in cell wall biosynthesis